MKTIGILATLAVTVIASPIWRGFVFSKLWLWFIVPTFAAAPLGIAQSIGVGCVAMMLTTPAKAPKKDDRKFDEAALESISLAAVYPAMALLFGWIVKQWI